MHIASNEVLNVFNSLIQKDLSFSQEIEIDMNDNSSSEGYIVRKDKIIEIVIEKPFKAVSYTHLTLPTIYSV